MAESRDPVGGERRGEWDMDGQRIRRRSSGTVMVNEDGR